MWDIVILTRVWAIESQLSAIDVLCSCGQEVKAAVGVLC